MLAAALTGVLASLAPDTFPRLNEIGVDGPVLVCALLMTGGTVVLAGLWPAIRASGAGAKGGLGRGGRGTVSPGTGRLGKGLVSLQVALALTVAVGSGLMLRSLDRLLSEEVGMDGQNVLTFKPSPPEARYETRLDFERYYGQVLERVAAVPGVTDVGAIHLLPGTGGNWSFPVFTGAPVADDETVPSANFRAVRPGYFETVRVPLLRGRTLVDGDSRDAEPVVVVNQAFVDRFWPGEDPLSQRLSVFSASGIAHRVVGVVGDVRQHRRSLAPLPEMYFTPGQAPMDRLSMWIMARFDRGPVVERAAAVRQVVWEIDPEVPIVEMDDMEAVLRRSTHMTRFLALLLTGFGALAVGLGAVGVFGVAAFTAGRRKPEFGLRMAVGATRQSVLRSALRQTLSPVAVGLVGGLAAAAATSRFLSAALYDVAPTDPVTFLGVAALLAATAVLASLLPAWRASRVDPASVLTAE
ncbi:MAG: FtsX-like permease family protein [Gemmatimonadetes bacterium]|nr:FtsX-like permease family protein [Gemmatimonadota bacterium]